MLWSVPAVDCFSGKIMSLNCVTCILSSCLFLSIIDPTGQICWWKQPFMTMYITVVFVEKRKTVLTFKRGMKQVCNNSRLVHPYGNASVTGTHLSKLFVSPKPQNDHTSTCCLPEALDWTYLTELWFLRTTVSHKYDNISHNKNDIGAKARGGEGWAPALGYRIGAERCHEPAYRESVDQDSPWHPGSRC